jgi:hypothetical protein
MTYKKLDCGALVGRSEAAQMLGVAESTLAVWACTKRYSLPFVKVGRLVKYRVADLEAFIDSRTVGAEVSQ